MAITYPNCIYVIDASCHVYNVSVRPIHAYPVWISSTIMMTIVYRSARTDISPTAPITPATPATHHAANAPTYTITAQNVP